MLISFALQDLELLLQEPASSANNQDPSPREQLLKLLHASTESQYRETDLVIHKISLQGDAKSPFTICQTKQDAVHGPTFELTITIPVANDFQTIGWLMWSRTVNNKDPAVVRSLDELERSQVRPLGRAMAVPT